MATKKFSTRLLKEPKPHVGKIKDFTFSEHPGHGSALRTANNASFKNISRHTPGGRTRSLTPHVALPRPPKAPGQVVEPLPEELL